RRDTPRSWSRGPYRRSRHAFQHIPGTEPVGGGALLAAVALHALEADEPADDGDLGGLAGEGHDGAGLLIRSAGHVDGAEQLERLTSEAGRAARLRVAAPDDVADHAAVEVPFDAAVLGAGGRFVRGE